MTRWSRAALPRGWAGAGQTTFVGRRGELALVDQAWDRVRDGVRQVVLVGGAAGAGKSRLAARAAARLQDSGAAVLLGTCVPEFGAAYQPFVEPLTVIADALRDGTVTIAGTGGEADAVRADAVEATTRRIEGLLRVATTTRPRPRDASGVDYQRQVYDAVVLALRSAAAGQPLLLVLEDLQWAGETALLLLEYSIHRTASSPVLFMVTHRTGAPELSGTLLRVLSGLSTSDDVRRIALPGLSTGDVAEYLRLASDLSRRQANAAAETLRAQTGGNPFFLRELWRDLSSRGGIRAIDGPLRAPESVREMIQIRLDRLDLEQRVVIEHAAVLGETVDVATLLDAVGINHSGALAALDTSLSEGLVEPSDGQEATLRFPHALARQSVLDCTPASRLAASHAHVAAALERLPHAPQRVQRLAHHYASTADLGHKEQAARYLREAAEEADRMLAHKDAGRCYERAVAFAADAEAAAELQLAAARSHLRSGDFARARELAEAVATTSSQPRTRMRGAIEYEIASWRPGRLGDRAVELLVSALRGSTHDSTDPLHVQALGSLGRALAFTGAQDEARAMCSRAMQLARDIGDDRVLAHVLQCSLTHHLRPPDAAERLALAEQLSMLAHRTGDLHHLGPASHYRAVIAYLRGDVDLLDSAYGDLLRTARVTGEPYWTFVAGCLTYSRRFLEGDFPSAAQTCSSLADLGASFGDDDTEGPYGLQMFMVQRETGALDRVRGLVTGDESSTGRWVPGLLALYTELGLEDPARRVLRELLDDDLDRYAASADWVAVLVFLVEAALALGDHKAAKRLHPMLAEYSGLNLVAGPFVAVFGSADRYLGALESLRLLPGAEASFEAAVEIDTRTQAPVHLAHSLAAWAGHLRHLGKDLDRAAELAVQARTVAEPLGLRRVLRELDVQEKRAENREGSGIRAAAVLTAREREVLQLIAEGLSNRDIAQRLFIAERTAANHISAILHKTGAANRTQAARYAAIHGLLP